MSDCCPECDSQCSWSTPARSGFRCGAVLDHYTDELIEPCGNYELEDDDDFAELGDY